MQSGPSGLEPPTSPLSGVRSNQLSYKAEGFPQARERKSIPVLGPRQSLKWTNPERAPRRGEERAAILALRPFECSALALALTPDAKQNDDIVEVNQTALVQISGPWLTPA